MNENDGEGDWQLNNILVSDVVFIAVHRYDELPKNHQSGGLQGCKLL